MNQEGLTPLVPSQYSFENNSAKKREQKILRLSLRIFLF